MATIIDRLQRLFNPITSLPPGMYHYISPQDDPRNYRLHLRLEPNGSGILIVNASTILHLNQTAAEYAYYMVKNLSIDQVANKIAKRYQVSASQAMADYRDFCERVIAIIETPDLDPETFLDFEGHATHSTSISAPFRLDCALTYRLNDQPPPGVVPSERVKNELNLAEWKKIFEKAWEAGIPHITLTGGEPTLYENLLKIIETTEQIGQVVGLITDGVKFNEPGYLDNLLNTGLDHILLILQPELGMSWNAVNLAVQADIYLAVHLTITEENQTNIHQYLDRLTENGVNAISLSATDKSLTSNLQLAREYANSLHLDLVWDLPVPYSHMNPVALETKLVASYRTGSLNSLYVEPDGDVYPSQGSDQLLGNMLTDPWDRIWRR